MAATLLSTQGCSAIGGAIGAEMPMYEAARDTDVDKQVVVVTSNGEKVKGPLVQLDEERATVGTVNGDLTIQREKVVEVKKRVGDHFAMGIAIGALVDVLVLTAVGIAVASALKQEPGGGSSCWTRNCLPPRLF
jgi:hypothetical protein